MKRRDFLKTSALAGAGLAWGPNWASLAGDLPAGVVTIPILHTTDLHGHILPGPDYSNTPDLGGLARCVTQLNRWRQEFPRHLLVDVGDLYQGTAVGWQTNGQIMVECLNHLNYDGWVIGNHEFDWGSDPLRQAIQKSRMPILSANGTVAGKDLNSLAPVRVPGWENLQGAFIKELAGYKIAVIGVTTPGLTYWIPDGLLGEYRAADPVEALRPLMAEIQAQKPDAIIMLGHMGLQKANDASDDFANRVNAICAAFPEITAFIGAHTHKDLPNLSVGKVPYTQANYHGINVGRLDLVFDPSTRKVVGVNPQTVFMGPDIELDPGILSLAHKPLALADEYLQTVVGKFSFDADTVTQTPGIPTALERVFGAAFTWALRERGITVDAVFHGMFWNMGDGPKAGNKTIDHIWRLLPFENYLVTAELSGEQFMVIMRENLEQGKGARSLSGGLTATGLSGQVYRNSTGKILEPRERVTIAFNAYDAQSGGQRLNKLREILAEPACKYTTTPVQTRTALIDFIKARGEIDPNLV